MKKRLIVLFVVLATMLTIVPNVFAAPAANKRLELVSIDYERTGIILSFKASGFTQDDLKNVTFEAESTTKGITCNLLDDSATVRCSVDKSLAGKGNFKVSIGGFIFWGELPNSRECGDDETYWYNFNAYQYGTLWYSGSVPLSIWEEAATQGWFDYWATYYGVTYENTGYFCGSSDINLTPA